MVSATIEVSYYPSTHLSGGVLDLPVNFGVGLAVDFVSDDRGAETTVVGLISLTKKIIALFSYSISGNREEIM